MEVRPAERREARRIGRMLARAFHEDPVQRWMFPEERHWERGSHRAFGYLTSELARKGSAYTTDGLEGAALWDEPGGKPSLRLQIQFVVLFISTVGLAHAKQVGRGIGRLERRRPEEPHWYLGVLGTDPKQRGRGIGAAVMGPVLERCDREGGLAYLESSRPQNIPFYERHGFAVTEEIALPEGPSVWGMRREPR